jgi:hypothetical protein
MLLDIDKITEASQAQAQRCAAFGARTAENIRAANNCQFALLPHEELARLASGWYAASAQAMLNANYSPISAWVQAQALLAAGQNFNLEDVLELLRICRGAAIQGEKWNEDMFSIVDDVINETFQSIGSAVPWIVPSPLNYVFANTHRPETAAVKSPEQASEPWSGNSCDNRRDFGRNCLKFPIQVRATANHPVDELVYSENVSRSGLYFLTRNASYKLQMAVLVTYPYWTDPGAINRQYRAKVVRIDSMIDGSFGLAVEFTESLGPRS